MHAVVIARTAGSSWSPGVVPASHSDLPPYALAGAISRAISRHAPGIWHGGPQYVACATESTSSCLETVYFAPVGVFYSYRRYTAGGPVSLSIAYGTQNDLESNILA